MPAGIDYDVFTSGMAAPIFSPVNSFPSLQRKRAVVPATKQERKAAPSTKVPATPIAAVAPIHNTKSLVTATVLTSAWGPHRRAGARYHGNNSRPAAEATFSPSPADKAKADSLRKRLYGIVKYFNGCYGFIEPLIDEEIARYLPLLLTEKEIFFHRNDVFEYGFLSSELLAECFAPGQRVMFELIPAYKGNMKAQAGNIRLCLDIAEEDPAEETAASSNTGADEPASLQ